MNDRELLIQERAVEESLQKCVSEVMTHKVRGQAVATFCLEFYRTLDDNRTTVPLTHREIVELLKCCLQQ